MDKLKQTFSRNKDGQETADVGASTGKVAGQGSHFPSAGKMDNSESLGSTVTSQQDQGVGGTAIDPNAARGTAGPEAGTGSHVNTIPASAAPQNTAAVAQTSTYSTHHLDKGDPTSSVVDSQSSDPTTYKKPETGALTGSSGVPAGSAEAAAKRAFVGEGMPGAYPSADYKNPYLAENLDPRVDGLPLRSKDAPRDTNKTSNLPVAAAAAGTAFGGAAAAQQSTRGADGNAPVTSALTSTANPSDRYAEYTESERTRVPGPVAADTTEKREDQQPTGFMGKALAAVGLGGAGAATGYSLASRDEKGSAISDTAPSDTTPHVGHSRKESIPTTAYPSGDKSPTPINAPVGGTRQSQPSEGSAGPVLEEHDRHVGRDATLGAASGVAAGGLISSQTHRDTQPVTGQSSTSQYPSASAADTTLGQDNTRKLRDDLASQPSGISSDARAQAVRPEDEDHSKRNAAIAGAGAGALGAGGAYAATQGHKEEPFGHTAILGPDVSSTTHQPQTSSSVQPHAASSQADTAGLAGPPADHRDDPIAKDDDHKARNAALAGGAIGAGVAGTAAGASILEHNKRSEQEAARQRAAADAQRRAAEKDAEKAQKSESKQAEKEQKKHQKEVEKAEKEHEKEVAAIRKQQAKEDEMRKKAEDKQRASEAEDEDRKRKAAAAAAVGGAGATGAGAYNYEKNKEGSTPASPASKTEEKEKKPGLFKRIFKRRKNKDTGESEDYSSDDEADKEGHHKGAVAGVAGGTAAVGAGAYGIHEARSNDNDASNIGIAHTTDTAQPPKSSYEAASGGAVKPSYNPFTKDDPSKQDDSAKTFSPSTTSAGPGAAATGAGATTTTTTTTTSATANEPTHPRANLGTTSTTENPDQITTNPVAARTAASAIQDTEKSDLPIEPTLGLPYDPAKDPEAARRLDEQSEMHLREEKPPRGGDANPGWTSGYKDDDDDEEEEQERGAGDVGSPSQSGGKKGFRQKLKEAITGQKAEGGNGGGIGAGTPHDDQYGTEQQQHAVLHKKPHQIPDEVRRSTEAPRQV